MRGRPPASAIIRWMGACALLFTYLQFPTACNWYIYCSKELFVLFHPHKRSRRSGLEGKDASTFSISNNPRLCEMCVIFDLDKRYAIQLWNSIWKKYQERSRVFTTWNWFIGRRWSENCAKELVVCLFDPEKRRARIFQFRGMAEKSHSLLMTRIFEIPRSLGSFFNN